MKFLVSIFILIIAGLIANFLTVFALNLAGLPGALAAGTPGIRSKRQFITGSIISAIGQSYVYFAYVALVVSWTRLGAHRIDAIGWLLWPFAFLAVMAPIGMNLMHARMEARELEHASPQVEALHLTVVSSFIAFFAFAFFPILARLGWNWVPYVS